MDEIDFYDSFGDSLVSEEYEGEGVVGAAAPDELAQDILENLQGLKSSYSLQDDDLIPLVGLLNDVFTILESVPSLRSHCRMLQEERDELEEQWIKEKERGKKRMEERSEYELVLERENKELKENVKELKKKTIDSESRLETVKTFYEEQRKATEEDAQKRSNEYNKLWGIIECYQQKYEQVGGSSSAAIKTLRRGHRYLSVKQGQSFKRSASRTPPTPSLDTPTSPVSTPTSPPPAAYTLRVDEPTVVNKSSLYKEGVVTKNQESQKDTEGREGQDETVSSKDTGSRNAGSHGVDVEQIPVKPRRVPRRKEKLESVDEDFNNPEPLAESSGEFSISSSGGEMEESGELHEMIAPEIEGGVTLAQELLNTKPDYLANTEMTRLLNDLRVIQKEKTEMVKEKESHIEEIASLQKRNEALTDDVQLLMEKEDRLKEELARAKDSCLNIEVDNDLSSESGLSFCCTKEELFSKLRELMEYKVRNIELKEQLARLREQIPKIPKTDSPAPKKRNLFWKLFKRTPKKLSSDSPITPARRVTASEKDYNHWITKKSSIKVENFVSITGWLLGPNAKKMISMLPTVVGKIGLGIFEVERVDCTVVARVTGNQPAPPKPTRQRKDLIVTKGTWTQGGIPNQYRSHAMPCNVEVWVATTARNDTKIEVVSIFAKASQHIQHMFKVNIKHIQCMKAVEGRVPMEKTKEEQSGISEVPEVAEEDMITMWLVSSSGQIHFHEVGALPFKRHNAITLDNNLGAFCIEVVNGEVVIGQQASNLAIFGKSEDGLWDIASPKYVSFSDFAENQDIRSILLVKDELWLGSGDRIIIINKTSYEVKGGIMINAVFDKPLQMGEMVSVGDTVVVTQRRGSTIVLCSVESHSVIGKFDITDLCSIYEQDKLRLKNVVVVSSITADDKCIYLGTKSGYVLCFSVTTMKEFLQESNQILSADNPTPSPDDKVPKEDIMVRSPIRQSVETSCSAVSLNGHSSTVRSLLHVPIPLPVTKDEETTPTESKSTTTTTATQEVEPAPVLKLRKRDPKNAPKRFKELIISVGVGHTDYSSVGQGLFNVVAPSQGHKTQVLVWGQPEK